MGVSRQTISNWENQKSYPDIISVIKMSEYYEVSLDYLLKDEEKMNTYYDYLEESTNVVKSNTSKAKILIILTYLIIWVFALYMFWFHSTGSDALGYGLVFFWFVLPITTFVLSIIIGRNHLWGRGKWFFPLFFGVMYMLADYGTYRMANNLAFDKTNPLNMDALLPCIILSLIGLGIGVWLRKRKQG